MQKMKSDHLLTPYTRIKSKLMKDLNVKLKTIKILEENISSKISDIAHSNILCDISPQGRETKEKISKLDCIKLKTFLDSKGNHQQNKKDTPQNEKTYLLKHLIGY